MIPDTIYSSRQLESQYTTMIGCQSGCLYDALCLGVDWSNDADCYFAYITETSINTGQSEHYMVNCLID